MKELSRRDVLKTPIFGAVGIITSTMFIPKEADTKVQEDALTVPDFKEGFWHVYFWNPTDEIEKPQFPHNPKKIFGAGTPNFGNQAITAMIDSKKVVEELIIQMKHWESYQRYLEDYGIRPKDSLSWDITLDGKVYKRYGSY